MIEPEDDRSRLVRANINWKIVAVFRNVVLRFHNRAVNATKIPDLRNRRKNWIGVVIRVTYRYLGNARSRLTRAPWKKIIPGDPFPRSRRRNSLSSTRSPRPSTLDYFLVSGLRFCRHFTEPRSFSSSSSAKLQPSSSSSSSFCFSASFFSSSSRVHRDQSERASLRYTNGYKY